MARNAKPLRRMLKPRREWHPATKRLCRWIMRHPRTKSLFH